MLPSSIASGPTTINLNKMAASVPNAQMTSAVPRIRRLLGLGGENIPESSPYHRWPYDNPAAPRPQHQLVHDTDLRDRPRVTLNLTDFVL